jgi:hypothetical protein
MRTLIRSIVAAAIVASALPVLAAPAAAAPALEVTPNTDLVDFQQVTVSGTGFTPGATIGMAQCLGTATDESGCDLSNSPITTADAAGSFETTFVVERLITVAGEDIDCAVTDCAFGVANLADFSESGFVLLSFDPNVPPQPRLDVDLSLAEQGTFDPRTGAATVSGTVTCNEPALVQVFGQVRQSAGRALIIGDFVSLVPCDGETPWQATTSEFATGLFKGGKATLSAFAFGSSDTGIDQDEANTTVKLMASVSQARTVSSTSSAVRRLTTW